MNDNSSPWNDAKAMEHTANVMSEVLMHIVQKRMPLMREVYALLEKNKVPSHEALMLLLIWPGILLEWMKKEPDHNPTLDLLDSEQAGGIFKLGQILGESSTSVTPEDTP